MIPSYNEQDDSRQNFNNSLQDDQTILTHIDKHPFFKRNAVILRTILQILSDITMHNLYPIIFSFLISLTFYGTFKEKYDFLLIIPYTSGESLIIVGGIILWNIITLVISKLQLFKTQFLLSRMVCVILHCQITIFQYRWFLTPGTITLYNFDHLTIMIFLWNSFFIGLVVFLLPVPRRANNYFLIYYTSQYGFFFWIRFTDFGISLLIFGLLLWDFLTKYIPCFSVDIEDYKRGFYYSNFVKLNKQLNFIHASAIETKDNIINDTNINNDVKVDPIPQSKLTHSHTKVRYHIPDRDSEISHIEECERKIGINFVEYGIEGLRKLEIKCKKQIEDGIHLDSGLIILYLCLIIQRARKGSMIGVLVNFYLIGAFMILEEFTLIFTDKIFPTKIMLTTISKLLNEIIISMVSPIFKNIVLISYFTPRLMDTIL